MAAADAYFRAFQTEGTPDYIRAPLLPSTLRFDACRPPTSTSRFTSDHRRRAFDNAMFKGTKVYDRRYPVVDTETGTVMALVRFHPPNNPAPGASASRGDAFVCEIFAIEQGRSCRFRRRGFSRRSSCHRPFRGRAVAAFGNFRG